MTNFLPEDYKIPTTGNYMKLQDGENPIRILSSAIVGYEYWNKEGKPVRLKKYPESVPDDIRTNENDEPESIKHFWAFVVWNYNAKRVQVLELTQKSIMSDVKAYVDNKKWGDPKGYDITINRKGNGLNTEYKAVAEPHTPLEDEIKAKCTAMTINLEALYDGGDPFTPKKDERVSEEDQELKAEDVGF